MSESNSELEKVFEDAKCAEMELLPEKSKLKYAKQYKDFVKWKDSKNLKDINETALMAYFYDISKKMKPSSMWAYYSMLKSTLKLNENVDISTYHKLSAFLKSKSSGYKPMKASVFSMDEINDFLTNAPDMEWLDVQVVCIFGICGALRMGEMTPILLNDVERHGNLLLVQILETKTEVSRSFTISGSFYDIVEKYVALRAAHTVNDRFFVNFRSGRCTNQVIGINKFKKMPERIATYLKLAEPKRFTGHSFRRSSATILANSGATMERIKRHGAWRSTTVAEGYIEESLAFKKTTGEMIISSITSNDCASAFDAPEQNVQTNGSSQEIVASQGFLDHVKDDEFSDDLFASIGGPHTSVKEVLSDLTNRRDIGTKVENVQELMSKKNFRFNNCKVSFYMK